MKKFFTALLVIVIAVGLYFIVGVFDAKPPSPTISVDGKKIDVAQGSYCWDGLLNASCVDTISPPDLIAHDNIKPTIVSPESELNIEFTEQPSKNTLAVNQWLDNKEVVNVPINNHVLKTPKETGVYVYDVHAGWKQGDAAYAFVIEVR